MKEKIYTIPLNEALDENSECLFCSLYSTLEEKAIEYTLGPSYMEPDVRIETNRLGFCAKHVDDMFKSNNKLGLALMMFSHFEEVLKDYEKFYKSEFSAEKKSFFNSKTTHNEYIENLNNSCFVCEKIFSDMDKFYDTFIYLWKKEEDFRKKVMNSKGFCLKHFDKIIKIAYKKLSKSEFAEFFEVILSKQKNELFRVKDDLDWFIKKFDYRFKDLPWNNSKDSLKRSIIKISSFDPEK